MACKLHARGADPALRCWQLLARSFAERLSWPFAACFRVVSLSFLLLNLKMFCFVGRRRWALFPDSSESQARYMNRHEEALLNLADSRYEWDLRVSSLESCLKRVEQIGKALARFPAAQRRLCTVRPSVFKQIHLSCLRRIFGPNTEQVPFPFTSFLL